MTLGKIAAPLLALAVLGVPAASFAATATASSKPNADTCKGLKGAALKDCKAKMKAEKPKK